MKSPSRFELRDLAGLHSECDFLDLSEVEALAGGRLPEDRLLAFEKHARTCPSCSRLAAECELFAELSESGLSPAESDEFERTEPRVRQALARELGAGESHGIRGWLPRRRLAWAVPLAAVVAALFVVTLWRGSAPLIDPIDEMALLPPPATRGPVSPEVWQRAEEAWAAGDLPAACRLLEEAAGSAEEPDLLFYLGYCRLRLDRPEEAIRALEAADRLQHAFPSETTRWYLAAAYDRAGRQADACSTLRAVAELGRTRADRARRIVEGSCPAP